MIYVYAYNVRKVKTLKLYNNDSTQSKCKELGRLQLRYSTTTINIFLKK